MTTEGTSSVLNLTASPEVKLCGATTQKGKPCKRMMPCLYHDGTERVMTKDHWTAEEHIRFLEGLKIYGKGRWREMTSLIPSRTAQQIRAHAYRYFKRKDNKRKRNHSINDADLEDINFLAEKIEDMSRKHPRSNNSPSQSPSRHGPVIVESISSPIRCSSMDTSTSMNHLPPPSISMPTSELKLSNSVQMSIDLKLNNLSKTLAVVPNQYKSNPNPVASLSNPWIRMPSCVMPMSSYPSHLSACPKPMLGSPSQSLDLPSPIKMRRYEENRPSEFSLPPISTLLQYSC